MIRGGIWETDALTHKKETRRYRFSAFFPAFLRPEIIIIFLFHRLKLRFGGGYKFLSTVARNIFFVLDLRVEKRKR